MFFHSCYDKFIREYSIPRIQILEFCSHVIATLHAKLDLDRVCISIAEIITVTGIYL